MRVGLIGLGDIAKKAYLPVLSEKEGVELVLCRRNTGEGCLAIGMTNRNGAITEEIIEYSSEHSKYVVDSLVETTHYHNKENSVMKFGDWAHA